MTVHIVAIGGRINSVWSERHTAEAHVARLIQVNGDQLAVRIESIEVRE